MDPVTLLLMTVIGIFIGMLCVTVGSSSLITIPFLMAIGLDPYFAIGTSKFAIMSSFITGGFKYYKLGVMKHRRIAIILTSATLIGAFIGANIVLKISEPILELLIIVLLILVLLITIFQKKAGLKSKLVVLTKKRYCLSFLVFFLLGIYMGFFGAGFGSFAIIALILLFGLTFIESAALMTIINFFGIVVAVIVFAYNKVIDYKIGIPLLLSIAVGGWIGAHIAVLKGNKWIKALFIIITTALIIKLIIDLLFF